MYKMSVGIVLPGIPGYSETFFRSKINGLQGKGAEVTVFAASKEKTIQKLPCRVRYAPKLNGSKVILLATSFFILSKAFLFNYKVSRRFLALERKDGTSMNDCIKKLIANHFILRYDLNWLHFGFGTMALGRENVAEAINAKMAVSFRGFDHYVYPLKNPDCYNKVFSKEVKYHVLSDGMKTSLIKKGISKNRIQKITPAIDINLFTNSCKENNRLQIVTVARLHWIKGLEYTLEALSILKLEGIDFHYTIVGEGSDRERLLFAAYQLGLEKNITFAGKLITSKVKNILEQADVYLQYSIQEGFCNSTLEAQAMGLLCIVSDAEGLKENVIDNQTGWVVPKRTPKLLANKLKEVIVLDTVQKNGITQNAVARVKAEFNLEKQMEEFIDFYQL